MAIVQQMLRQDAERRAAELRRYERERTELLDRERLARARAEKAEAGQRFLSEATAILTSSLEYEKTLERVTTLAVPQLADWCAVTLVGPDGQLRMAALAHADPARITAARAVAERYPISADAPIGVEAVIRTGRAQLGTSATDDLLALVSQNPEGRQDLLDLTSYIIVPLSAHQRVFGALSLATTTASGRRYGPAEMEIAEHLGQRAGLAIENARLFREAQEASRQREQVLAIVSHDLRNPLAAARMAAEIIAHNARDQNEKRLLKQAETIGRATCRMERLIGDLLDMASIHVGKLKIETTTCKVDALVQEAVEPFEILVAQQGIRFIVDQPPGDLCLVCDRERILQVFSNLLGNAVKFTSRGGQITLRTQRQDGEIQFAVSDTGPGISDQERAHIFDAYWSSERKGVKGTGLGLFIARGVIAAHGGRIWFDSEPGRDTTFYFTLPLC
jgi:signal transduction histidine kinase